jgi:hypothetical protein
MMGAVAWELSLFIDQFQIIVIVICCKAQSQRKWGDRGVTRQVLYSRIRAGSRYEDRSLSAHPAVDTRTG